MVKIAIIGASGRMGNKVLEACRIDANAQAVFGIDRTDCAIGDFPIYDDFAKADCKPNVIIDFSAPASLEKVLDYALKNKVACVLCPTGYTEEQIDKINQASKQIAIFRSANMSIGVNAILGAVKEVAKKLYDFDIEIIEKHHHNKVDAPSGTALMLADGVKEVLPDKFYIYGREGIVGKRNANEIGIHAIRGGNIVGEHDVIFAGENEIVTISHTAQDRSVFADGAVKAAIFMADKTSGLYNMNDMLK